MFTPKTEIDYIQIATATAEWIERNYGYFVNKNSDKVKIINDFAEQLERLPVGAMSYIKQTKNNIIDTGNSRPPSPATFIQELKNNHKRFSLSQNNDDLRVISIYLGKRYCNTFEKNGTLVKRELLQ